MNALFKHKTQTEHCCNDVEKIHSNINIDYVDIK